VGDFAVDAADDLVVTLTTAFGVLVFLRAKLTCFGSEEGAVGGPIGVDQVVLAGKSGHGQGDESMRSATNHRLKTGGSLWSK
jgi:hypothetical protein